MFFHMPGAYLAYIWQSGVDQSGSGSRYLPRISGLQMKKKVAIFGVSFIAALSKRTKQVGYKTSDAGRLQHE